jgi:autotransporter translocation and assembly factor TamB
MSEGKTIKSGPKKKTKTRILKSVLALAVVVIVLVVFVVPGFVSSEKGRKIILAEINSSIDGEIDFASLSMGWWKGVKVTDIGFNDSAGRVSVKVKRIATKPYYGSILTGSLSLGETEVLEPRVEVNLAHPQAQQQRSQEGKAAAKESRPIALPIKRIEVIVKDGNLKVTDRGGETAEVAGINSKLTILPLSISSGKLGFTKAEYMGLNFGPTEVDIQIENGLLRIAPFSSSVNNGQFNFAGEVDLSRKPTLLKTPGPIQVVKDIQINERAARGLLMYLNPVFANAVKVSGVANFECEKLAIPLAGGTKDDIEVIGTISIKGLRLEASDLLGQILSVTGASGRGVDITIHPTRFILRNGFLKYDDMQMDVGDNPVNFRGVIGLDKSLSMTVTLPYTTAGKTARVGKEVEGARISLPLRGTVDKPKLDLGKLLEGQLKQQLQERLMKELEGVLKK